jgi:predicted NBD/HSP70 family sugar kinase
LEKEQGSDNIEGYGKKMPTRKQLEQPLLKGNSDAAGVVQAAIDDFSAQLASVIESYLEIDDWKKVNTIIVGGGMRGSRLGEIAIGRTQAVLFKRKINIDLRPIRSDPDEAGLIGAVHLAPPWIFTGYDAILAVDIGGTNIRAGVVVFRGSRKSDVLRAKVVKSSIWEHAKEEPARDEAIERLLSMMRKLARWAKKDKVRLAPFVGIGCPGRIRIDGAIDRGTQNLPGNWEADRFNLPGHIAEHLELVPKQRTVAVMHNDAVLQGLSELPYLDGTGEWAVLTIGTGLGNAKFTLRDTAQSR